MNSEEAPRLETIETRDSTSPQEENSAENLKIEWMEREVVDDARIGAMYCFKSCDRNKN